MRQRQNEFSLPSCLLDRPVIIKIEKQSALRVIILHYDPTGYWIQSDELSKMLIEQHDVNDSDLKPPAVFVPMHRIEWLITPATR